MEVETKTLIEVAVTPVEIANAIEDFLKTSRKQTLVAMADAYGCVAHGRLEQAKETFLVQQLKSYLARVFFAEDASKMLHTFQHYAPAEVRFFKHLSQETLEDEYFHFIACYGKASFLFYLLCDEREERRSWAKKKMEEFNSPLPSMDDAKQHLLHHFDALFRLKGDAPIASRQSQAQLADLKQQLENEKKKGRQERKEIEKKHQDELRVIKEQLATATFNISEIKKARDGAVDALAKEITLREERVQQILSIRQIELFRGWLRPHLQAEEVVQSQEGDLLEAIEDAIHAQKKYDRVSNNIAKIQDELELYKAKQARLDKLLQGAHQVHPMMRTTYLRLKQRIEMLENALPESAPTPLEAKIMTQISTLKDNQLPQLLLLIELLEKTEMLSRTSVHKLRQVYNKRASIWEDVTQIEEEEDPAERRNPELRDALRGQSPMMLFLDGHNILNGLGRYRQRLGSAKSHEKMRERVQKDVVNLILHLPMCMAHLVWDGPTMQTSSLSENVQCHYSGGEGEHRADRYILDQLKFYREVQMDIPVILVTDDNGFAGEARRLGAKVCRLQDFEAFIPSAHHG